MTPSSKVCNLGEHAACVWLLCACACHGEGPATAPGAGDPEPEIEQALADYSVIAAPNPSEARGFRVGYRAALGRRPPAAGSRPFDKIGADRLADEVAVLVRRGVIDSRSPAADALLDYRNPPSSPRADRLAALEEASAAPPAAGSREARLEAALRAIVAHEKRCDPHYGWEHCRACGAKDKVQAALAPAPEPRRGEGP